MLGNLLKRKRMTQRVISSISEHYLKNDKKTKQKIVK